MTLTIDPLKWGYIGIKPEKTLEEVAAELGKALDAIFFVDDSGYYEEYPAYRAIALGCELALLGIPPDDSYLGETPLENYSLHIANTDNNLGDADGNIADFFIQIISRNSSLNCWAER